MGSKKKKIDADLLNGLERVNELLSTAGPDAIGHRVRRLRNAQGLSVRQIAEKASVSKSSIVRLEQGRGSQAITILKVCSALGVHVERLAGSAEQDVVAAVHRKKDDRWFDLGDMASKPLLDLDRPLTLRERKKAVATGAQIPVNLLHCRLPGGSILSCILEISKKTPVRSHVGEEFVYVLSGSVLITVGKEKFRLKEGESLTFWSAEPHAYAPADSRNVPVQILSVRVDG